MNFKTYQKLAYKTTGGLKAKDRVFWTLVSALGLAGEAGEVVDYIKKVVGFKHDLDREKLKEELGDCLWYISDLCTKFNISLDDTAKFNIQKLKKRYPKGFSRKNSKKRS